MRSVLAIGGLLLVLSPAAAEPNPETGLAAVQKHIDGLSSRRFAEREKAGRALISIGEPALEPLRAALGGGRWIVQLMGQPRRHLT